MKNNYTNIKYLIKNNYVFFKNIITFKFLKNSTNNRINPKSQINNDDGITNGGNIISTLL